jgi:hypothetical protein
VRRQKKKSRRPAVLFPCPIEYAAVLNNQGRRFRLPYTGTAIEETAMLIQSVFQTHSFLKKACFRHGSGLGKKMYYTM